MANAHRNNVLVTSCLKQPVDPQTRAPLASYEREKETPNSATVYVDNRDDYQEKQDEEPQEGMHEKGDASSVTPQEKACTERMNLHDIFFSNEEYYSKLEDLKKAHLRTMAELESMYHHKMQLHNKAGSPYMHQRQHGGGSQHLRKSRSAAELLRDLGTITSSSSDEAEEVEKGQLFSPKEYIKNMWTDFKLSPRTRHLSTSLPGDHSDLQPRRRTGQHEVSISVPKVTVPKPFQMTLREAERRRCGIKTRSEVELENAELRRQLEEMSECHKKFRASPVPAHLHLPLYEELQERQERRRNMREERHLKTKPFSFLERERLKKEQQQKQQKEQEQPVQPERPKPFKAKPVPKSVYAAAAGELKKEEQLFRSMKKQMRAEQMLQSAAAPPSTLTKRLAASKKSKAQPQTFTHRPHINKDMPDHNNTFRRFQKRMERNKEVKPTTVCEPFQLRTAKISHRERTPAEKQQNSPQMHRWPYVKSSNTANSSLCSSLSGSMELLPAKDTDATKKRHEAVRQALERRKRAEQEEARWTERQKEREKNLQKLVQKRASANDPHLALTQTHDHKLQEFRKQDRQRRKEYQQEIREIEERVKGRPLLLEQVAQKNAKQAAQKHFADTLHKVHLSEDFVSRKAAAARARAGGTREPSESEDAALELVHYRKVLLDDQDQEEEQEEERDIASPAGSEGGKRHHSDRSCNYSDDDDHYSDEGERDQKEAKDEKRDEDQEHA
ncbi:protein FAM161B isoform X1 [Corythoichthys intestinalis]|uniref:protein FAM161B isoform X1 n=1 Tax=Corythoichthys intestinalis TaxID=161448 RepID=UPI0025A52B9A|nr:protein FAM161B isoform X1 [Corythoichthys intestinalis]